jgi:hypothetical protein
MPTFAAEVAYALDVLRTSSDVSLDTDAAWLFLSANPEKLELLAGDRDLPAPPHSLVLKLARKGREREMAVVARHVTDADVLDQLFAFPGSPVKVSVAVNRNTAAHTVDRLVAHMVRYADANLFVALTTSGAIDFDRSEELLAAAPAIREKLTQDMFLYV